MEAVIERQVDILRLLLEKGGDAVVNEKDEVSGLFIHIKYVYVYIYMVKTLMNGYFVNVFCLFRMA